MKIFPPLRFPLASLLSQAYTISARTTSILRNEIAVRASERRYLFNRIFTILKKHQLISAPNVDALRPFSFLITLQNKEHRAIN